MWSVPFALFISLSANDYVLPTTSSMSSIPPANDMHGEYWRCVNVTVVMCFTVCANCPRAVVEYRVVMVVSCFAVLGDVFFFPHTAGMSVLSKFSVIFPGMEFTSSAALLPFCQLFFLSHPVG